MAITIEQPQLDVVAERKVPAGGGDRAELVLDAGFVVPDANAFGNTFRNYDAESERKQTVEEKIHHQSEKEKENEKEKEKEKKSVKPWVGRCILGVTAAGAVAVAAGAFFLLSSVGDSSTDKDDQSAEEEDTSRPRKTMKGPGSGGEGISRNKFNGDAVNYFKTLRKNGSKAAVDKFQ